jgi:hypothetical protein
VNSKTCGKIDKTCKMLSVDNRCRARGEEKELSISLVMFDDMVDSKNKEMKELCDQLKAKDAEIAELTRKITFLKNTFGNL